MPDLLLTEEKVPLARAFQLARVSGTRGAARPHPSTLVRYVLHGGRAVDRRLVKLEAVRIGSTWFTSTEAVARFLAALSGTAPPADGGRGATPGQAAHATARPSPGRRRKQSEKAEQTLIAAGF